jgi:hypothetical protein
MVAAVLVQILSSIIQAASSQAAFFATFSLSTHIRERFVALTSFASVGLAIGLLLAAGLARVVAPKQAAPFRAAALWAAAGLSALLAAVAVVRALVLLTYSGRSAGFALSSFLGQLVVVPIALVAAALAFELVRGTDH